MLDELPWQVIYIGDRNMVWNLVNQRRHHNAVIRNAIAGNACVRVRLAPGPRGARRRGCTRQARAPGAAGRPRGQGRRERGGAVRARHGDYVNQVRSTRWDAWKAGKYAIQPFWNRAEDADIVKWARPWLH